MNALEGERADDRYLDALLARDVARLGDDLREGSSILDAIVEGIAGRRGTKERS